MSATLALDVFATNTHSYKFPKAKLLERIGDQPMMAENWLLAYEADRLFEYKLKAKNLSGAGFFEELYDNDAEFYDRDAVPAAFADIDDPGEVESALENVISYYDYDDADSEEDPDAIM